MGNSVQETDLLNWLKGKKTYIVAVVTLAGYAIQAWNSGDWSMFWSQALPFASGLGALRAAISKVGV